MMVAKCAERPGGVKRGREIHRWCVRPPRARNLEEARHLAGQALKILEAIPPDLGGRLGADIVNTSPEIIERQIGRALEAIAKAPRSRHYTLTVCPPRRNDAKAGREAARRLIDEAAINHRTLHVDEPAPGKPGYVKELVVKYRLRPVPYGSQFIRQRILASADVLKLFRWLRYEPREHSFAVYLDNGCAILAVDHVGMGGIESTPAPIDLIIRNALLLGASNLIAVHNHPCGNAAPSSADFQHLVNLRRACDLIGLKVTDYVIIGEDKLWSAGDHRVLGIRPAPFPAPLAPDPPARTARRGRPRRKA